jgi:hypothetical protein
MFFSLIFVIEFSYIFNQNKQRKILGLVRTKKDLIKKMIEYILIEYLLIVYFDSSVYWHVNVEVEILD